MFVRINEFLGKSFDVYDFSMYMQDCRMVQKLLAHCTSEICLEASKSRKATKISQG